jgi:photosystem II stability/assembly factor-like uncharacterized protein
MGKKTNNIVSLKIALFFLISTLSLLSIIGCGSGKDAVRGGSSNREDNVGVGTVNVEDRVTTETQSRENIWQQMPLRSRAQKNAEIEGGEGMQNIFGIAYAPGNPNIVYLVSNTSQVWKSVDGGKSWNMKHVGFLASGGISLVVHPNNEDIVFVAGARFSSVRLKMIETGIYRTRNGGDSWELVYNTPFYDLYDNKGGVNFAITDTNTIYAGTHEEGLLKSTDGGNTWASLNVLTGIKILDVKKHPKDASIIFLATEVGLYKVTDNGTVTLEQIGNDLPDFPRAIAVNHYNPKTIFVTVGLSGVYKSVDGGINFSPFNNGLLPVTWGKTATYLAISPVDPNILYVSFFKLGGNQPYYTVNGGDDWVPPSKMDCWTSDYDWCIPDTIFPYSSLLSDIINYAGGAYWGAPIAPNPIYKNIVISPANGNNLMISTNGGETWTYNGSGYSGGRAGIGSTSFSWDKNNPNRFALFLIDFGVVLTEDRGSTFRSLNIPRYKEVCTTPVGALDPTSGSEVIVTATGTWTNQVIAVTNDNGTHWTLHDGTNGTISTEDNYMFIAFHPQNPDIIYAGKYRSADKGKTWFELQEKVVAMFNGNGNIVYSANMQQDNILTIRKSTERGDNGTWNSYPPVNIWESAPFEIVVDPENEDRIYVATSHGIEIYDGSKWIYISDIGCEEVDYCLKRDRFGSLSTRNITVDPNHPNVVYAGKWIDYLGHADGIYRSTDYGQTGSVHRTV